MTLLSVSAENTVDPTATDQSAKTAQYTLTASAAAPLFVPDYQHKYYLQYMRDDNADATLSLHTDANGLLSTANGEYVDQTAAEAATFAQIAAAIASGGAGGAFHPSNIGKQHESTAPSPTHTIACLLPAVNRAANFTPDQNDKDFFKNIPQWQASVPVHGKTVLISTLEGESGQSATIIVEANLLEPSTYYKPPADLIPNTTSPGVLFRDWQPWKIAISIYPSPNAITYCHIKASSSATVAMLPNGGAMFYVDVNREALIDKKVSLAVTNGMLTGVDVSRPSPTLATLKLPLTILQPIVALPFTAATSSSSHPSGTGSSTSPALGGQ